MLAATPIEVMIQALHEVEGAAEAEEIEIVVVFEVDVEAEAVSRLGRRIRARLIRSRTAILRNHLSRCFHHNSPISNNPTSHAFHLRHSRHLSCHRRSHLFLGTTSTSISSSRTSSGQAFSHISNSRAKSLKQDTKQTHLMARSNMDRTSRKGHST